MTRPSISVTFGSVPGPYIAVASCDLAATRLAPGMHDNPSLACHCSYATTIVAHVYLALILISTRWLSLCPCLPLRAHHDQHPPECLFFHHCLQLLHNVLDFPTHTAHSPFVFHIFHKTHQKTNMLLIQTIRSNHLYHYPIPC
jgi:hypothetical protein